MKVAIAQYTNLTNEQNAWVFELSGALENHFSARTFGDDLEELYFGLITVKPEFNQFFKPKRPRYLPGKHTTKPDGIAVTSNNCAEIDVKIEFQEISSLSKNELLKLVSTRISEHLKALTRLSKLKRFDFENFEKDFNNFLSEEGYLDEK